MQAASTEVVLPSIENPGPKRVLESGIEYSARRHVLGAGKRPIDLAENVITRSQESSDRQPESLPVDELNPVQAEMISANWSSQPHPGDERIRQKMVKPDLHASPNSNQHIIYIDDFKSESEPPTNLMKQEPTEGHGRFSPDSPQYKLRSPSPPTFNPDLRVHKLEKYGLVELPKAVMELEETRKKLAKQENAVREQGRLEKGKYRERDSDAGLCGLANKEELAIEISEAKKQHPSMGIPSQYPRPQPQAPSSTIKIGQDLKPNCASPATAPNDLVIRGSKRRPSEWNPESSSQSHWQRSHRQHGPKSKIGEGRGIPSRFRETLRPKFHQRQTNRVLGPRQEDCTCAMLPEFFLENWQFIPEERWPGGRLEFLEHIKQISSCRGHPENVRRFCQKVLRLENYPGVSELCPTVEVAKRQSSMDPQTSAVDPMDGVSDNHLANDPLCGEREDGNERAPSEQHLESSPDSPPRSSVSHQKRCKSMPALRAVVGLKNTAESQATRQGREKPPPQPLPAAAVVSGDMFMELAQTVKRIENFLLPSAPTNQSNLTSSAASSSAAITNSGSSQPRKKKQKTAAERKATDQPEYDRNVPEHLRHSEEMLIQIGRIVNGYTRHERAPEVFAWNGRLYSEFDRLLTKCDMHGNVVWDWKTISRLKR